MQFYTNICIYVNTHQDLSDFEEIKKNFIEPTG